jgi:hypothetical protein
VGSSHKTSVDVEARCFVVLQATRELCLAVLPDWETKRRVDADEEHWQQRLAELKAYRAADNDWPRHKAVITGKEQELGVWLHTQRYKARRGALDSAKTSALDEAVPGWRQGRKRGRPVAAKERDANP